MNYDFRAAPKTRRPRQTKRARLIKRMDGALTELARAELVRALSELEPAYLFKHALVQDTAQASLLKQDYKRLHRRVAEAYEKIYADRCMDEFAALLAKHYAEAGDDANTLAYARHAGDVAASAYANVEAIAFYTQALDAAKRINTTTAQFIHLYTKRGRVYEVTGRDPVAMATYQEMGEYARARGDRALELEALLLQGKLRSAPSVVFDRAHAIALAGEAEQIAAALGDRLAQAKNLWNQLILHHYSGESAEAIRCGEQAMALARELGARELLAYISGDLARSYLQGGQMAKSLSLQTETRALWKELDNKPMLADALMQSATLTMMRGEYDRALALTEEGIELSKAIDSKLSLLSNQGTQLFPLIERGEFARALQTAQEILHVSVEMKLSFNGPLAYTQIAWMYGVLGAFARGEEMAQTAREILNHPLPEFFRAWGWVMLANYYLARGDLDATQDAFTAAHIENAIQSGGPASMYGAIALGQYLYARGEFSRASELMAKRVNELGQFGTIASLHEALYIQARAARALGDTAQALELLHQAREVAEGLQARRMLWQIYAALGEMETERGNMEQANAYRDQARAALEFIVSHTPEEFRESFMQLPRVREVLA